MGNCPACFGGAEAAKGGAYAPVHDRDSHHLGDDNDHLVNDNLESNNIHGNNSGERGGGTGANDGGDIFDCVYDQEMVEKQREVIVATASARMVPLSNKEKDGRTCSANGKGLEDFQSVRIDIADQLYYPLTCVNNVESVIDVLSSSWSSLSAMNTSKLGKSESDVRNGETTEGSKDGDRKTASRGEDLLSCFVELAEFFREESDDRVRFKLCGGDANGNEEEVNVGGGDRLILVENLP